MTTPTNREPIAININRQVEVTLTEFGLKLFQADFRKVGLELPDWAVVGKPIKFQLWELMRIYGPHIVFGRAFNPFEGNNIVLLPDADAIRMEEIEEQ